MENFSDIFVWNIGACFEMSPKSFLAHRPGGHRRPCKTRAKQNVVAGCGRRVSTVHSPKGSFQDKDQWIYVARYCWEVNKIIVIIKLGTGKDLAHTVHKGNDLFLGRKLLGNYPLKPTVFAFRSFQEKKRFPAMSLNTERFSIFCFQTGTAESSCNSRLRKELVKSTYGANKYRRKKKLKNENKK